MKNTIYLFVFLLSLTFSSCGTGEHSTTADTGSASFGLIFEQAPAPVAIKSAPSMAPVTDICSSYGIDTISGTVYNSSNTAIATGGPWACSAHQGTINNIPPGSNLRIAIKGTVSGTVVWQGETTGATIYAGQDTNVGSIPMTYTGNDTTRPTVSASTPTGTTVPLTSPITVTFSEAMAASTIDTASFTLKNGSVAVPGSVSYNATNKTATFTPTSSLLNSTVYTATVTTDVTDMAANKMLSLYTWNFTTEAPPGSAPTAPTGVSATAADKQITVSWTAVTGATSYNIYWSNTTGVTKTNGTQITGATSPYIHTALTNGTTYYYIVTAVNSYGESTASTQTSAMPLPPITSAPTGVSAAAGNGQTTISWSAVSGATSYNLYWSTTTGVTTANGTKVTGATSPYTHSGLTNGTTYYYIVTAVNIGGESTASSQASATPGDTTAPTNTTSSNFINGGASSATSTSVTLALSATDTVGVTAYYASETSNTPSASGWTAVTSTTSYSASVSFTLSTGDGTKTVYIWFKDAAGNVSAAVSDSITLSTVVHIPDTGQTTSYTGTFGEDHDYTINSPSYTDNGDGTITDNLTGLVWQKEDDATTRTWSDAGTYCTNLSLTGIGWRLPTDLELMTIVDYGKYSPSINTSYFPNTQSSYSSAYYWSSIPYNTTDAWIVNFSYGFVRNMVKTNSHYVRCVRGGQITSSFTDNGNGTVTDAVSTLVWQKQDDATTKKWEQALTYCEGLSLGGFTDWRLPNAKELRSIAGSSNYFPNTGTIYWSSTTCAYSTTDAWGVWFSDGFVYGSNKTSIGNIYVRCVRGGQ